MPNSFIHCPSCGSKKLNKRGINGQECLSCGKKHYHHDSPSIGALIVKNSKILLGKRNIKPFKNYWDVPGGFINPGEHPKDTLKREVKEELNIEVTIEKLLGIYLGKYGNTGEGTLNFHYICTHKKGKIIPASDLSNYKWFSLSDLPSNIAFDNCRRAVRDLVKLSNIKKNQ